MFSEPKSMEYKMIIGIRSSPARHEFLNVQKAACTALILVTAKRAQFVRSIERTVHD